MSDIKLYMASQQSEINTCAPKMKAQWTPEFHKLFVSLCLEQVVAGNKPGTHLNKKGWKNVMDGFYEKTGIRYDKKQFKNHWDSTKDQWKVWNKLKSNTIESGWDQNTQSVNMSDAWWVGYLQVLCFIISNDLRVAFCEWTYNEFLLPSQIHPEAAQFHYKGLPLADLLDTLFSGVSAVGAITRAPSQGSLPNVDMGPSQTTPRQENNPELPNLVLETHMRNQESTSFSQGEFDSEPPLQRRKMNQDLPSPIHRRMRDLGSTKLDSQLHRFCEVVESRSTATSAPREEYTIKECIGLLNEMSEIQQGGELYMFALDVFLKKEYRELFIALGISNMRLVWLRRQQKLVDG